MSYRTKLSFSITLLALILFYAVVNSEAPRYGGSVVVTISADPSTPSRVRTKVGRIVAAK